MVLRKYLIIGLTVAVAGFTLDQAVVSARQNNNDGKISGKYIVVLKNSTSAADTQTIIGKHGVQTTEEYSNVIKGFSANMTEAKVSEIKKDSRVAYVVQDRVVSADGKVSSTTTTTNAQTTPNGVKRIGNSVANNGSGVKVAVLDSGVDLTHPDLKANLATVSKSCVSTARTANDDNGHGTHVAGTIAAVNNTVGVVGVASGAKIVPVKVLDRTGNGSWSTVICGIDWVTANAAAYNIKVANMSLSGTGVSDNNCGYTNNDPLHQAICRSTAAGVTYVVAAGNEGVNASSSVPASYDDAVIAVSALADTDGVKGGLGLSTTYGADDTFASFSNYGSSVDIAAPGVNIKSTWRGGTYSTINGTSMASPHVAGAAVLYLKTNPSANWQTVKNALISAGEANGFGHADASGNNLHPEPVVLVNNL